MTDRESDRLRSPINISQEIPMTPVIIAYISSLLAFAILDAAWLWHAGPHLYKPVLGDILAPQLRLAPAAVFYLMFPAGLVYFAIGPALKESALATAMINGALFGLFTYGTYELTNYATLRNWTSSIVLIDVAYGVFMSAVVAGFAYKVATLVLR